MTVFIDGQHAKKRKKIAFKPIYKSAGYDTGFIKQFNQKPIKKSIKKFPGKPVKKPLDKKDEKKGSGFTIPLPSFATLAVIAGTVVITLAALNWEDINNILPEKYIYQPAADSEGEFHAMQYAATGITGILPLQNIDVLSADVSEAENQPFSQEQDDLIVFEWYQHRVQKGESVSVIAEKYDVSVGAIIASNEIRNARTLQEGALIRIPNIDGIPYQIKNGDSLSKIAASFNVPLEVILDINDIKSDNITAGETIFIPGARMNDIDLRMSLGELFMHPVPSRFVTSSYGMRKDPISGVLSFHTGIDLRANTGTPVVAALDGVISVVSENWLYGKHIIITHPNGYKTLYGHLNSFSVKQGDRVARGRKIGESGNTGYSTGPHLHFSIYDNNGKLINPLDLLR